MKASELYSEFSEHVDELQKDIQNKVRDQLGLCRHLIETQETMKRITAIVIKDGDRELTGEEVLIFQSLSERTR